MKRISTYLIFLFTLVFSSCISTQQLDSQSYTSDDGDITYQQFYDDLSPYGNWVSYQNYGYVWVPDEAGFRPYYNNGHWVYTNYGWTWVSDYNWGWAPFHYGRWLYDDNYGWMWVPGYEWAPAWVSWRNSPDYYGWAPLGPGANFSVSIGSQIPYNYWAFVPHRYITSPRINNYYIDRQKNVTIINNTTIINNIRTTDRKTQYVAGPTPTDFEKNTNEKIRQVRLVNRTTPGNTQVTGNSLSIYKPPVKETPQTNTVRPPKVSDLNLIKARRINNENGKAENSQQQIAPVTEQKLPSAIEEKPKPQPHVNQQILQPTRIQENKQNPPQQNNEQVRPQKNLQEKVIQQRQENNLQKNNEPVIKNNPPVTKDNPPVNVQENKPPLKIKRNVQPVQRKLNIPSTPVNRQPVKVQQNRTIQQPKQNYQAPRERPAREMPVIKNQIPIQQPPIKRQEELKR